MIKALIIGGGIAGPVTAMGLRKAGIDAEIYEAYETTADNVGTWLALGVNGIDALRCLDLDWVLLDNGFNTHTVYMYLGASGRKIAEFPLGGKLADGTPAQTAKRADIYRSLHEEAARRGVKVNYGKRLVDATNTRDGVLARFADGSTATGDLLIGADGLHSRTRTIIDPSAPKPRYSPLLNTAGYAEGLPLDIETGVLHMVMGQRAFFGYLKQPNGQIWWYSNPQRANEPAPGEMAAIPPGKWRAELIDLHKGDRIPAVDIINASKEIQPGFSTYDYPSVPVWHRGRIAIIGDAIHAVAPSAGQGVAMAAEDAVVMAKCLRDIADVPAAFRAFERLRRDRVEGVVKQGQANSNGKSTGPVGRVIRDMIMPNVMKKRTAQDDPERWIWSAHIDWDEPVRSEV